MSSDPQKAPAVLVGIDLVQVSRVGDSLARFGARYVRRLFTADEIAYCTAGAHRAAERFAARFAAKEATLKVLRTPSDEGVDWRAIEVRRDAGGWCDLVLHGAARALARRRRVASLALSMSHEADYATAVVVAQLTAPRKKRGKKQ